MMGISGLSNLFIFSYFLLLTEKELDKIIEKLKESHEEAINKARQN